jgi:predicted TIM-barrel fold metal-dependent hydrolase
MSEGSLKRGTLLQRVLDGQTLSDVGIIDCHFHIGDYVMTEILTPTADEMAEHMELVGVDRACMSSFLAIGPNTAAGNQIVADAIEKHPDKFMGYAVVNPNYPETVMEDLERAFEYQGMVGLKFHMGSGHHDYPATGEGYRPALEFANRRGLPILGHGWGEASVLESLSERYPDAIFIYAHRHSCARGETGGVIGLAKEKNNVYLDLASSRVPYGGFENLVEAVGPDKILFGSDFPLLGLSYQLGRVLFGKISDNAKIRILGKNFEDILARRS